MLFSIVSDQSTIYRKDIFICNEHFSLRSSLNCYKVKKLQNFAKMSNVQRLVEFFKNYPPRFFSRHWNEAIKIYSCCKSIVFSLTVRKNCCSFIVRIFASQRQQLIITMKIFIHSFIQNSQIKLVVIFSKTIHLKFSRTL